MDLTTQAPRSPYAELGGYTWLPRLIDKARAKIAGTIGEYMYPCPMDVLFLNFYQLDADTLLDHIRTGADDEAIAAWIRAHAAARTPEEARQFRRDLLESPPADPEKAAYLKGLAADLGRPDIDTFAKLIAVDEHHPIPASIT